MKGRCKVCGVSGPSLIITHSIEDGVGRKASDTVMLSYYCMLHLPEKFKRWETNG